MDLMVLFVILQRVLSAQVEFVNVEQIQNVLRQNLLRLLQPVAQLIRKPVTISTTLILAAKCNDQLMKFVS